MTTTGTCKYCGENEDEHLGDAKICPAFCNCSFDSKDERGEFETCACPKCKIQRQSWGGFTTLAKYQDNQKKKLETELQRQISAHFASLAPPRTKTPSTKCKFGSKCTRRDCMYAHASPAGSAHASAQGGHELDGKPHTVKDSDVDQVSSHFRQRNWLRSGFLQIDLV